MPEPGCAPAAVPVPCALRDALPGEDCDVPLPEFLAGLSGQIGFTITGTRTGVQSCVFGAGAWVDGLGCALAEVVRLFLGAAFLGGEYDGWGSTGKGE